MVRAVLAALLAGAFLGGVSFPARGEDIPTRVLPVAVAVDARFQENPLWEGLVRRAVENATRDLAEKAGLRFSMEEPRIWTPPDSARSWEAVLARAAEEIGSDQGLTAVFLGGRPAHLRETEDMGIAYLAEPTLIVLSPGNKVTRESLGRHLALYFRHELGHVFGVPHMEGRTVMNPRPQDLADAFDPLALDILRANRNMDFHAEHPFAGSDLPLLKDVYLLLAERGEIETMLLRGLGTALYRAERGEDARELFRAAVHRERHSASGRLHLARSVATHGDTVLVREILEDLSGESLEPDLLGTEGRLWMDVGAFETARGFLDRAIEESPERFDLLFNRGLTWFHQGRFSEAVLDFQKALEVTERPEGWFNLGLALNRLDRREDAGRAFERYLDLVPEGGRSPEARKFLNDSPR